jgi:hypothetical protein
MDNKTANNINEGRSSATNKQEKHLAEAVADALRDQFALPHDGIEIEIEMTDASERLTRGLIRAVLILGLATAAALTWRTITGLSHRVTALEAKVELLNDELLQFESYD